MTPKPNASAAAARRPLVMPALLLALFLTLLLAPLGACADTPAAKTRPARDADRPRPASMPATRPLRFFVRGDKVAWVGSSSTQIGVWPKTMEFLLRTRHPELGLTFVRNGVGGATFASFQPTLDPFLAQARPTVVIFNFGGNDANAGEKGLAAFRANVDAAVASVRKAGARAILMTHQPSDLRFPKVVAAAARNRTLYAQALISHAQARGYEVIDTHGPLEQMLFDAADEDPSFTIMKDQIHLNEAGYVAWGLFLYRRLDPPPVESAAVLTADGKVVAARRCRVEDVVVAPAGDGGGGGGLSFVRTDEVLPILPPAALPPRKHAPLEALSRYVLAVTGLERHRRYEVLCEGRPVGIATGDQLAAGINLNSLLLASGQPAPWSDFARDVYDARPEALAQVGRTRWKFEVRPAR